jgi:TonB family protein
MTIIRGRILSLTFLIIANASVAIAQDRIASKASTPQTPPTTVAVNDNDRARDGLVGPVRRIRTEVVKVASTDGKLVENGKRVLLEAAEYDLKGTKTVNQYFPVAASAPTGREVYKYDDRGNISEMTLMGANGSMVSRETYKYEYDSLGNWTRMTTSVAVVENGAIGFEPTEVTYRTISYYLDSRMTNLLQPANNSAQAPANSSATVADNRNANSKAPAQPTMVPTNYITRRSPVMLTTQSSPFLFADLRNASFTTNQKVLVDNAPPPPPARVRPPVSQGVLNGNAISLPPPVYPESARRMRIEGVVEIDVMIDENGRVVSAKAISGPASLRDSAVEAAQRAKFTPSKLSGQPVKVTGKIVYNFKMAR